MVTDLLLSVINQMSGNVASMFYFYVSAEPRLKNTAIGPKIWSEIPEHLKSLSPYSFGNNLNFLLSC